MASLSSRPLRHGWRRPIGGVAALAAIAAVLAGTHQVAAQEACAPAPTVNDLCPDWTSVHDGSTVGPVISVDSPSALAAAPDGSRIFVAGQTTSDETGGDMTTIALDPAGNELWTARYHQPAVGVELASDIAVSPDGSVVFTAGAEDVEEGGDARATVVAYDAGTGEERWIAVHDGASPGNDGARGVAVSPDGGIVYVAMSSRRADGVPLLRTVAYDAVSGAERRALTFAGTEGLGGGPRDLVLSPDGSRLYVLGSQGTDGGGSDYLTLAYDVGDQDDPTAPFWAATYDGPGEGADTAAAIDLSSGGEALFVTGTSDGDGSGADWATVSYDAASGVQRWVARSGGDGDQRAAGLAVAGEVVAVTGRGIGDAVREGQLFVSQPTAVTVGYAEEDGAEVWSYGRALPGHVGEEPGAITASPDGSRVYVTHVSGVLTLGSQGGCSGSTECRSVVDPGTVALTALAAEDGRETWTARLPGTGNLYRPSAVPVVASGDRVYAAATQAYPYAQTDTGVPQAQNLTDLSTSAYRVPETDPRSYTCSIHPRESDLEHTGGGFGTPQVRVEGVVTEATDRGLFVAECGSTSFERFEMTVRYRLEFSPSPGTWEALADFACTKSTLHVGGSSIAAAVSSGDPKCPEAQVEIPVDHPSLGLPHRLCVHVFDIGGCSRPWTHEKVGS